MWRVNRVKGGEALIAGLRQHIAAKIGKIARPQAIILTDDLPKARSGKIMRRLLWDVAHRRSLGDVTTLANADGGGGNPNPGGDPAGEGVTVGWVSGPHY